MNESVNIPLWLYVLLPLVAPILGFLGLIISQIYSNRRLAKSISIDFQKIEKMLEDKERNRTFVVGQMLLPRTLDAMQKAFEFTMQINRMADLLPNKGMPDSLDIDEQASNNARNKLLEIRIWYDQNCFYLPRNIRDNFLVLINLSLIPSNQRVAFWQKIQEIVVLIGQSFNDFLKEYSLVESRVMNQ
jgi:hypothetical protein